MTIVQGFTIRPFPCLVNFLSAVAYHICLHLPAAFSQPGNGLIVKFCRPYFTPSLDRSCR